MRNLIAAAVVLLILLFGGYYFWSSDQTETMTAETTATEGTDTDADAAMGQAAPDGPTMEITVAGEANGTIVIELFDDVAPKHVERIRALAEAGAYDGIVFHRVIDGFMAQTGDVEFGQSDGDTSKAGRGGSDMPDLPAEFSDKTFARGIVGMARSNNPDSANSQFFIMFAPAPNLDGQYTVVGRVVSGLDVLDAIKMGTGGNGAVLGEPDRMKSVVINE